MDKSRSLINLAILEAIKEQKWLHISYINRSGEPTSFFGGIVDVNTEKKYIRLEIFNPYKDLNCLEKAPCISLDGIQAASVIPQSYFDVPEALRTNRYDELYSFFDGGVASDHILRYLFEAYKNDTEPYVEDTLTLPGIDEKSLVPGKAVKLTDADFETLIKAFFLRKSKFNYPDNQAKYEAAQKEYEHTTLCFNEMAFDISGKTYVVAYYYLNVDFKRKTIKLSEEKYFNKSFCLDHQQGKVVKLGEYVDEDPDSFEEEYRENPEGCRNLIRAYLEHDKLEKISLDTRPLIYIVRHPFLDGVSEAFSAIQQQISDNELSFPLKSFFGRNRSHSGSLKDPFIVIFDKNKVNIDQMRVISNAMVNHTTYVKGPPGTGKTETIFNVILSAYANNKKCLICSNNNHPLDDIYKKMSTSFDFHNGKKVFFPIIRLGNMEVLVDSLSLIRDAFRFAEQAAKWKTNDGLTEKSKKLGLSGDAALRQMLSSYEHQQEVKERIAKLNYIATLKMSESAKRSVIEQAEASRQEYRDIGYIDEDKASSLAVSADESQQFKDYLYYSSLSHIKKLNGESFLELRSIAFSAEGIDGAFEKQTANERAASDFAKYLNDDENLERFLQVFPMVVCTNDSANRLGGPSSHFDFCIMDEAGQCNVATSLISIVRCDNLVLVGDTNQLQPVTVIDPLLNAKLISIYSIDHEYDYVSNSILSTMMAKDNNSKTIMLRYHYRCGRKIVAFSNQRFYAGALKPKKNSDGSLAFVDVKNRQSETRNCYLQEAKAVVDVIQKGKYKDVGIITPFRAQAKLINEELARRGIQGVSAGTVHSLQGSEKSTIILSPALSTDTGRRTMDWVKNNKELINVAVTRAKDDLIIVGDKEAIDALSKRSGELNNDIQCLADYVYYNGEKEVVPSEHAIIANFSNNSKSEEIFLQTIKPYFDTPGSNFRPQRNVPVRDVIKNVSPDEVKIFGKKEFDVVVFGRRGNEKYHPVVIFEVDGGEHVASRKTRELDAQKEAICRRYGLTLIRVSNSQVKDYELIIQLFEGIINHEKVQYTQMSLFEETEA